MQEQPDLYSQYHEGFRRQAAEWPQQPVDVALSWLKAGGWAHRTVICHCGRLCTCSCVQCILPRDSS
jgi:Hypothetical methyltransferase